MFCVWIVVLEQTNEKAKQDQANSRNCSELVISTVYSRSCQFCTSCCFLMLYTL